MFLFGDSRAGQSKIKRLFPEQGSTVCLLTPRKKSVWGSDLRFRAKSGTVKTIKDSFIPFREMHLHSKVFEL